MANPLEFTTLRNKKVVEPSVSGTVELQTIDPTNPDLINDLIILHPFRSGPPLTITRFKQLSALRALHDPDDNGDEGVALAATAKNAFADPLFSAADILTVRVGHPTPSTLDVKNGATVLGTITTTDYGSHTRRSRRRLTGGTLRGKKLFLGDDARGRQYVGDNLGPLMTVQYVGNGSAASLTLRQRSSLLSYDHGGDPLPPEDTDLLQVNGTIFEFDDDGHITAGHVAVPFTVAAIATAIRAAFAPGVTDAQALAAVIGAHPTATLADVAWCRLAPNDADAAWAAFVNQVNAGALPGVVASQSLTNNTVTLDGPEDGVAAKKLSGVRFTDPLGVGAPTSLVVALTDPSDGSADLLVPFGLSQFSSLQQLVAFINSQYGYTCSIFAEANKFLPCTGLDVVTAAPAKAAPVILTGYMEAIADWVNTRTQGHYTMEVFASGIPDEDVFPAIVPAPVFDARGVPFNGGTTPPVVSTDWLDALTLLGAKLQLGGIILPNTDDATIFAMVEEFIAEQLDRGLTFSAYFATHAPQTPDQLLQLSAALDSVDSHLVCQRAAVFDDKDGITYVDPIYFAAILAGGASGNRPWDNPLTMKRIRVAGIHPDDDFDIVTRESLESGGLTLMKTENGTVVVAFDLTTSHDPSKRMPRIASEVRTVRLFEANLQAALRQYRGTWGTGNFMPRVVHTFQAIAINYEQQGAIVAGVDEFGNKRNAWELGVVELFAGVLKINYGIWIGGEVDQISEHGVANYQRQVAIPTVNS